MEQLLANALINAARYVLTGVGLAVIYRASGCIDFSQGAMYLFGAYLSYVFSVLCHLPLPIAILLGALSTAGIGGLVEWKLYRLIRSSPRHDLSIMVISLGVLILLQNTVSLVFQDVTRGLPRGEPKPGIHILGADVTPVQMMLVGAVVLMGIAYWFLLEHTRWGMQMRAVSGNAGLASVIGIRAGTVILGVAMLGSGLTGLAGGLNSLELDMQPIIGYEALLQAVFVTLLAGSWRMKHIVMASLLLAGLEGASGFWISTLWKEALAFTAVLVVLVIRPYGFAMRTARRVEE